MKGVWGGLSILAAMSAGAIAQELHSYSHLAMTPAGDRLAYVDAADPGGLAAEPHGKIVIRVVKGGDKLADHDPCLTCRYSGLTWSPDGAKLAFVAVDRKTRAGHLFVADKDGVKEITHFPGVAAMPRWSPSGDRLALLATVGAKKLAGAVEAGAPMTGDIGSEPDEQRIAVIAQAGGAMSFVSPPDTYVYEYDWTPDGRAFVATAAKGDGDNNWWVAQLVRYDLKSGKVSLLAAPKYQMNRPVVSPDGKRVAFIGGLMSDFGSVGGDIYLVPIEGGTPADVTPGYAGSFTGLSWVGSELVASAVISAQSALVALEPGKSAPRVLWSGLVRTTGAHDGHFVFDSSGRIIASALQDFATPPHVVAGALPQPPAITHDNDGFAAAVSQSSVEWTSDGYKVQGWLVGPLKRPEKPAPMVVLIHGGPSSAATPSYIPSGDQGEYFNTLLRDLTARGAYVFEANPRGSYGQGEAFTAANVRDFGGGDLKDILRGIDAAEHTAPIDDQRLGVMGHSYGGFMTMWTVTHSDRFKAAIAGAGIANWISYYGENGIDQWMIPFFGASAYDDPAIYHAASPIDFIKSAKTPTFIYVGERDVECPASQSVEFWHGLRAMNVPASLVIYEGEGHRFNDLTHIRDLRKRELAWFEKYLGLGP